jgi:hypothetical protein
MLIFANGEEYAWISKLEAVTSITNETDEGSLENMHLKVGENYPVYIISAGLGDRGEDYRAPGHPLGICMLIAGTFPDARTRI